MKRKIITALITSALVGVVSAQSNPVKWTNGLLSDAKGMTLYTFDKDTKSKSNCNDACLKAWPALVATSDMKLSAPYGVLTRDDGAKQISIDGKPLYYFAGDTKPGDANGDKSGGVWHVVY
jgi:predicted lipoprotein with Yx(FWY)xxD motif